MTVLLTVRLVFCIELDIVLFPRESIEVLIALLLTPITTRLSGRSILRLVLTVVVIALGISAIWWVLVETIVLTKECRLILAICLVTSIVI